MTEIFEHVFPGMMLMWIMFIAQNTMADIYVEHDKKTLHRLLVSTPTLSQVLLSKMIRCFLICLLSEIILILITSLFFGVSWGNPLKLGFILITTNISITGLLALIYALSKTKQAADAVTVVVVLSTSLVSGSMIPYEELPPFLKTFSQFTLNRWGIMGIQSVMQAKPFFEQLKPAIILTIAGLIMTFAGTIFMKRRLEAGGAG